MVYGTQLNDNDNDNDNCLHYGYISSYHSNETIIRYKRKIL